MSVSGKWVWTEGVELNEGERASRMTGVLIKGGPLDSEIDTDGRQREDLPRERRVTGVPRNTKTAGNPSQMRDVGQITYSPQREPALRSP